MKAMKLVIIGPPGCGKGTISQIIEKESSCKHISIGEVLREHVKKDDELGHIAQEYIDKGEFVPDHIIIKIMETYLLSFEKESIIIDGFPRNKFQTAFLVENFLPTGYIRVDLSDEKIIKRLSGRRVCPICQTSYHIETKKPKKEGLCDNDEGVLELRKDDEPAVVLSRLEKYHEEIKPIIEIFKTYKIPELVVSGEFDLSRAHELGKQVLEWQKKV